jgi:hypothetical protein
MTDQKKYNIDKAKAVLMEVLRRPIAYHVVFAEVSGGVTSGVFLSQLFYWADRGKDPDGWIYKTQDEWQEETGLSRREQETARKRLKRRGILEEKLAGMPARLHYRINLDHLIELVYAQSSLAESANQVCTNPPIKNGGKRQSSLAESANQECTNPPNKFGETRQTSLAESAMHAETTIDNNREHHREHSTNDADVAVNHDENDHKAKTLITFGMSPSMANQLAASCSSDQIHGWIAYIDQAQGLRNPVGFLVSKLREGEKAPEPVQQENIDERPRDSEGRYKDYIQT